MIESEPNLFSTRSKFESLSFLNKVKGSDFHFYLLDSGFLKTPSGPVVESIQAREPGLQASSNLAGSKIKNTHVFFPHEFFLRYMISNIGESMCHVSCIHSEGKAIKPTLYLKFSPK